MTFSDPTKTSVYMKLLHSKVQIMEMKLQLAKLFMQKMDAIVSQYYEKASQLRTDENHLKKLLLEQRAECIQLQSSLEKTPENLIIWGLCEEILREIATMDESKSLYNDAFKEFCAKLLLECDYLTKRKNECIAAHNFAEANALRDHIHQIGVFLANQRIRSNISEDKA